MTAILSTGALNPPDRIFRYTQDDKPPSGHDNIYLISPYENYPNPPSQIPHRLASSKRPLQLYRA